jgi:hypothetical protein
MRRLRVDVARHDPGERRPAVPPRLGQVEVVPVDRPDQGDHVLDFLHLRRLYGDVHRGVLRHPRHQGRQCDLELAGGRRKEVPLVEPARRPLEGHQRDREFHAGFLPILPPQVLQVAEVVEIDLAEMVSGLDTRIEVGVEAEDVARGDIGRRRDVELREAALRRRLPVDPQDDVVVREMMSERDARRGFLLPPTRELRPLEDQQRLLDPEDAVVTRLMPIARPVPAGASMRAIALIPPPFTRACTICRLSFVMRCR